MVFVVPLVRLAAASLGAAVAIPKGAFCVYASDVAYVYPCRPRSRLCVRAGVGDDVRQ